MLTLKLQLIIIVLDIIALGYILNLVRRKKLDLKYSLVWLIAGLIILILVIFPNIINFLSEFLGIYNPVNMLFFLGLCLSLTIIFVLTIQASRSGKKITKLTQENAILKKEIEDLKN